MEIKPETHERLEILSKKIKVERRENPLCKPVKLESSYYLYEKMISELKPYFAVRPNIQVTGGQLSCKF